jgi:hypothetical protein
MSLTEQRVDKKGVTAKREEASAKKNNENKQTNKQTDRQTDQLIAHRSISLQTF